MNMKNNEKRFSLVSIGVLMAVILTAGLVFASLAEDLVNREDLTTFDPIFGNWLISQTTLTGDQIFSVLTFLGNALVISTGTALLGFWFARKKYWDKLFFLFGSVGGSATLNLLLKNIFQRTRPFFLHAYLVDTGYSFPSGHAMISLAFYGALAILAVMMFKSRRAKILIVICAFLLSALIGFSRLYLGVHFLTDILAGWSLSILWLAVCVLGVQWFRRSSLFLQIQQK